MDLLNIRDIIYEADMQAVAFDIGSNFDTGIYGAILGMSITNLVQRFNIMERVFIFSSDTTIVDELLSKITTTFPLPLVFRLGIENEVVGPSSEFVKMICIV